MRLPSETTPVSVAELSLPDWASTPLGVIDSWMPAWAPASEA